MARLACVDLPAFPLQVLLRRHPEWKDRPAVVVDHDKAQGRTLWANEAARQFGILPGMSYAQGLSLCAQLVAGVVSEPDIEAGLREALGILTTHSPRVEVVRDEPGVFFLDPTGLERLAPSASAWARGIRDDLAGAGLAASVVVGFSRFGAYAAARSFAHGTVFRSEADEREALGRIGLDRLNLPPGDRDHLARLGVHTVGAFLALPESGLTRRFSPATLRLHREGAQKDRPPLRPEMAPEPLTVHRHIDPPEAQADRLLFVAKQGLAVLTALLAEKYLALARLDLELRLEDLSFVRHAIEPAEPTLDRKVILNLVQLKWSGHAWTSPVSEMRLTAHPSVATTEQLSLFHQPRRDPAAADRALARIRAELGEDAVRTVRLREGHLPEAQWEWVRADRSRSPRARPVRTPRRVRRIFAKPLRLDGEMAHAVIGWPTRGSPADPAAHAGGPFPVSGGWWNREIRRRYFYVETESGQNLWIYFDEVRKRWFCQGLVE
ncbi:MAG: DNA polymerase Y family protein [Deltaproteobacteria bacterium]|nr:DNA polymerase Y family protein [Deltaproteobacteria bacterium]